MLSTWGLSKSAVLCECGRFGYAQRLWKLWESNPKIRKKVEQIKGFSSNIGVSTYGEKYEDYPFSLYFWGQHSWQADEWSTFKNLKTLYKNILVFLENVGEINVVFVYIELKILFQFNISNPCFQIQTIYWL